MGQDNWTERTRAEVEVHLDALAAEVAAAGLDVLVLNEADFDSTWSHGIDQAVWIAERAGFGFVASSGNSQDSG